MLTAVIVSLFATWLLASVIIGGAAFLGSPVVMLPGGFPRAYTIGSLVVLGLTLALAGVMTVARIPGSGRVLGFAAAIAAGIAGAWAGSWTAKAIMKIFTP